MNIFKRLQNLDFFLSAAVLVCLVVPPTAEGRLFAAAAGIILFLLSLCLPDLHAFVRQQTRFRAR